MHDRLLRHNTPPLGARTRYLAGRRSMTTPGPAFCSTAYIKTRTFRHVLLLYDVFCIGGGHTARLYTKHTALTVVTILTICFVFWMTITANSDYFGKEHGRLLMEIVSDYCGCEVHSLFVALNWSVMAWRQSPACLRRSTDLILGVCDEQCGTRTGLSSVTKISLLSLLLHLSSIYGYLQ